MNNIPYIHYNTNEIYFFLLLQVRHLLKLGVKHHNNVFVPPHAHKCVLLHAWKTAVPLLQEVQFTDSRPLSHQWLHQWLKTHANLVVPLITHKLAADKLPLLPLCPCQCLPLCQCLCQCQCPCPCLPLCLCQCLLQCHAVLKWPLDARNLNQRSITKNIIKIIDWSINGLYIPKFAKVLFCVKKNMATVLELCGTPFRKITEQNEIEKN